MVSYKSRINVFCATDNNYAPHAGVMLFSLIKNCSVRNKLSIFILDTGISIENETKLKKMCKKLGVKIKFVKLSDPRIDKLKVYNYPGKTTYYRLLIPELFKEIDLFLYLDADLIIQGDISEIYFSDFEKTVKVVEDDPHTQEIQKLALNISPEYKYFNAGVMLVNSKRWRERKITKKTLDFLQRDHSGTKYADQDALNYALFKDCEFFGLEWNAQPVFFHDSSLSKHYGQKKIMQLKTSPKIIHYASRFKPWHYQSIHVKKKVYWSYLKDTPWKSYKFEKVTLKNRTQKLFLFLAMKSPVFLRKGLKRILQKFCRDEDIKKIERLSR